MLSSAEPMSATADRERVAEDPIEITAGFHRPAGRRSTRRSPRAGDMIQQIVGVVIARRARPTPSPIAFRIAVRSAAASPFASPT